MQGFLFLTFVSVSFTLFGQDSTHRVALYDHTLSIPVSWEYHLEADSSGYITDGIDTLCFHDLMAVAPVMIEMVYYTGWEDDPKADSINAQVRRYNDSIREVDPRVGTHYDRLEHGNNCWYEIICPLKGFSGAITVDVIPNNGNGFLLWTTKMEWEDIIKWKDVVGTLR